GNERVSQRRLVVDAEEELRELRPARPDRVRAIYAGQRAVAVELVAAARGAEHRNGLQSLLEEVETELPRLVPAHPRRGVGDVVGVLGVFALLRLTPGDAAPARDELRKTAGRRAGQADIRRGLASVRRVVAWRGVA